LALFSGRHSGPKANQFGRFWLIARDRGTPIPLQSTHDSRPPNTDIRRSTVRRFYVSPGPTELHWRTAASPPLSLFGTSRQSVLPERPDRLHTGRLRRTSSCAPASLPARAPNVRLATRVSAHERRPTSTSQGSCVPIRPTNFNGGLRAPQAVRGLPRQYPIRPQLYKRHPGRWAGSRSYRGRRISLRARTACTLTNAHH